tara:strand:+ start:56 stop:250 length:195 start_codon:yes stop_codon:yes gene_type:complete
MKVIVFIILALADYGMLVAGNPSAYKELARFNAVSGKCWSAPVVANGSICSISKKERVCFQVRP